MSGRAIPRKLANFSPAIQGLASITDIDVQYTQLLPLNASTASTFSPSSNRIILFKVPAYSSCVLDTARSNIEFVFKNTSPTDGVKKAVLNGSTGSLISRIVVKSEGVVIQDSDQCHILRKIHNLMETVENQPTLGEGCYTELTRGKTEAEILALDAIMTQQQKTGETMTYRFNTGIFATDLQSFLPIGWVGAGAGTAFEVQLHLTHASECMKATTSDGFPTTVSYELSNVRWNMCLLKLNESLSAKFNSMTLNGSELKLPFTTYTSQSAALNGKSSTGMVSDSTTDISRVFSVIVPDVKADIDPLAFKGSWLAATTEGTALESVNYNVGNKKIFNESLLAGEKDQMQFLNQIKASVNHKMALEAIDSRPVSRGGYNHYRPVYERGDSLFMVADFRYSNADGFLNGINLGSLPLVSKFVARDTVWSGVSLLNFVESNYNLVIASGRAHFVEVRNGSSMTSFSY